jgi:hypothetical protein
MNPLSRPRQQQQKQQQQQKTLRIKKQENTLEFHSRLIEAAEGRCSSRNRCFSAACNAVPFVRRSSAATKKSNLDKSMKWVPISVRDTDQNDPSTPVPPPAAVYRPSLLAGGGQLLR